jgi:hypothetical protein
MANLPPSVDVVTGDLTDPPSLDACLKGVRGVFLLWTAIAGVFATQLYFAGLTWSIALAWTLPRWYTWGLVTPAIFWIDRRLAEVTSLPVRLALHVPLGVVVTVAVILLRLTSRFVRGAFPPDLTEFFLDRLYSDLPIYAVIVGFSFSRHYADQVKRSTRPSGAHRNQRACAGARGERASA